MLPTCGSGAATPPGGPSYRTASASYVTSSGIVAGVTFTPLVNSGETAFDTLFEGIPDGIGVVPAPAPLGYVDLFVNHEQSRVPFLGEVPINVALRERGDEGGRIDRQDRLLARPRRAPRADQLPAALDRLGQPHRDQHARGRR